MKGHIGLATCRERKTKSGEAALGHGGRAESKGKTDGSGPLAETEEAHGEDSLATREKSQNRNL